MTSTIESTKPGRMRERAVAGVVRAAIVLALLVAYLSHVFRLADGTFLESGLDGWLDPYLLNVLMEHWHQSVWRFTDPASPPMYYPARGTLGYSSGLVLYAPFYLAVRTFLHPFPAYTVALFLVMLTGALCLYLILRRVFRLHFIESLLLTLFFTSSANVLNGSMAAWSQRGSIFLVPPLLLVAMMAARVPRDCPRIVLAALAGLLGSLLFTQDFYSGQFALLFGMLLGGGALLMPRERPVMEWAASLWSRERRAVLAFAAGGGAGALVFLWSYLGAYLEHRAFPVEQLLNSLRTPDPSAWRRPLDVVRDLSAYESFRSFTLVFLVGGLAWTPWLRVDRKVRLYCLWFLFVSAIVLLVPLRFDGFSLWRMFIEPLPGFSVIRDPTRIIYTYELVAVLATGLFVAQLPRWSWVRVTIAVLVFVLLVSEWNTYSLAYARPVSVYDYWVTRPIDIDPACESFFVKGASEEYTVRSGHLWSLYGVDALFVSLHHSIPTLNGYSAWWPDGWELFDPGDAGYLAAVERWMERHDLRGLCEFDIEARTMTRYRSGRAGE